MSLTQEDKDFINQLFSVKSYPAYQYSRFSNGGRDEQFVIRANTWAEFIELKKNLDLIFDKHPDQPTTQPAPTQAPSGLQAKCVTCQTDMVYKTGVKQG